MPKEFPGFYFDEAKNRYFPLSQRPRTLPSQNVSPSVPRQTIGGAEDPYSSRSRPLKRRRMSERLVSDDRHAAEFSQFAATSRHVVNVESEPSLGGITAFLSLENNGNIFQILGDESGWLYTRSQCGSDIWDCPPHRHSDEELPSKRYMQEWSMIVNAGNSQISSISSDNSRFIATCFGPSSKIVFQDLSQSERTQLLSIRGIHDIRASCLTGRNVVLGAASQAFFSPDVENMRFIYGMETHSDVFTVAQHNAQVYTGARNGSICRFDTRVQNHLKDVLFSQGKRGILASSVVHLVPLNDWSLLVSRMDGQLGVYDLRYSKASSSPIMHFREHVGNALSNERLGLALDSDGDFLFAAGSDARVRGWSIRSGRPLLSESALVSSKDEESNPFTRKFQSPVTALQITECEDEKSLWVSSGRRIERYCLGQRGGLS